MTRPTPGNFFGNLPKALRTMVSFTAILIISALLLSCSNAPQANVAKDDMTAKEAIEQANKWRAEGRNRNVGINAVYDGVVFQYPNGNVKYDYEGDSFYVAIAPYLNYTHNRAFHSFPGCSAELAHENFDVKVVDNDGNLILEDTLTSLDNGFFEIWVKRDNRYKMTIKHNGKSVTTEFTTFEGDKTCLTNLRLT